MSTTLGARYKEKALASGLQQAVKNCVMAYDKENNGGDPRVLSPGLINAVFVSTIAETIAIVLVSERGLKYSSFPLWRQRITYRFRTAIAAAWVARCLFRTVFQIAGDYASKFEADPNWLIDVCRSARTSPVANQTQSGPRPTYL